MRILSITSLAFVFVQAQIVDLGTVAETYPVKEKSFKVSIREGIEDFNVTRAKNQLMESFQSLVKAKSNLPLSMEDKRYARKNVYRVPTDIIGPHGKLVYREGEVMEVSMPKGAQLSLCFVDARYPTLLPLIAKEFGSCIYMVANNKSGLNYPSLLKNSADGRIYPLSEKYIRRFGIKQLPTKIILRGSEIDYTILNMKRIMKEGGIR